MQVSRASARGGVGRLSRAVSRSLGAAATALVVLAAAAAVAGCGGEPATSPSPSAVAVTPGGHLRVGAPPGAGELDPALMGGAAGDGVLIAQVLENLVVLSEGFTLQPMLATGWTTRDLKHWEFALRDGVRFSNGARFTSADVVYTFERLRSWELGSPLAATLANVQSILATDRVHVTFVLEQEDAEFPNLLADGRCKILCRKVKNPMDKLIGTGPFVLAAYEPGERAVLRRNAAYWGVDANGTQLPYVDKVSLVFSQESADQLDALRAGRLDWIGALSAAQKRAVEDAPDLTTFSAPTNDCWELQIRCDRGPGRLLVFRQALMCGTDRQAIIELVAPGAAAPGNGTLVGPLYEADYRGESIAFDQERARQLLADAGYAGGVEIELAVPRHGLAPALAAAWKTQMQQIGVAVVVKEVPAVTFYAAAGESTWSEADFSLVDWSTRLQPVSYLRDAMSSEGRWNHSRWSDAQFDALVRRIPSTPDASERADLYGQAQEIAQGNAPLVNLLAIDTVAGQSRDVAGVALAPDWTQILFRSAHLMGETGR